MMYNISSVSALSYGGSPTFSIPSVYTNTGVELYNAYYNNSLGSSATAYPLMDIDLGDTRMLSYTFGIRFTSGALAQSGTYATFQMHYCNAYMGYGHNCWGGSQHWYNTLSFKMNASSDGKTYFYLNNDDTTTTSNYDLAQFSLPSNSVCPGVSEDCILVVQPRFYQKKVGSNQGLYLPYIDYTWYYGSDKKTQYFRAYFGDLTETGPNPSTWQSVLDWLGLDQSGYGLFLGYNSPFPEVGGPYHLNPYMELYVGFPLSSPIVWNRTGAPSNDDTLLRDYFVGNTGSIIETLFPTWVGSTGLQVSVIGSDGSITNPSSGGTGSTIDFSSCTSFLDVGCYIQATYNGFSSWVSGLWSGLWSYFIPDISFTGQSSTCLGSGSTLSSSGGLDFMQKFVNLFVVAVPIAPPDNSTVCTLDGQKTIDYTPNSPSFVDLILIFVCVLPIFFGGRVIAGTNKQ